MVAQSRRGWWQEAHLVFDEVPLVGVVHFNGSEERPEDVEGVLGLDCVATPAEISDTTLPRVDSSNASWNITMYV